MLAKTYTAAINGLETNTITVEVNLTRGVMFRLSGLADTSVKVHLRNYYKILFEK